MLAHIRSSLTYANVMATAAVFVALGGTSYAVATGSIDSRELKNNTVRSKDIRNNDVRSTDVRDRSLLAKDFKAGELPAGPTGPQGATGPAGATGAQGATGSPAASFLPGAVPQDKMPVGAGSANGLEPIGVALGSASMLSPNQTIVLRDLAVRVSTAPGAGAGRVFSIGVRQQNQPPSPAISCTITDLQTSCTSTGTATIPPGSRLTLHVANTGAVNPAASSAEYGYRAIIP